MSIIIEGADLVGKTTLAKHLAKKLGLLYQHMDRPPTKEGIWGVKEYSSLLSPYTIRDRFHTSELVYSSVLKRSSKMSRRTYMDIDKAIYRSGSILVLVTADQSLIKERYSQEGDNLYNLTTILHASSVYLDFFDEGLILADMHVHFTDSNLVATVFDHAVNYIEALYHAKIVHLSGKTNNNTESQ